MLKAPEYLSPSSISTFHQCPLKYKFSRIDGMSEPPTEHTLLGNFVHEILENFYALDPSMRTMANARVLAHDIWGKYSDDVAKILRFEQELKSFRWRAWWCVENLLKIELPEIMHFDGIETALDHEVDGVRVKGFIDRWSFSDNKIVIGDYKTGKVPALKYRADKFDQLLIYGVILSEIYEKEIQTVELLYLKDGIKLTLDPTTEQIQKVKDLLTDTRKQIDIRCESEVFEPTVSALCGWCNFKPICPEWSKK